MGTHTSYTGTSLPEFASRAAGWLPRLRPPVAPVAPVAHGDPSRAAYRPHCYNAGLPGNKRAASANLETPYRSPHLEATNGRDIDRPWPTAGPFALSLPSLFPCL